MQRQIGGDGFQTAPSPAEAARPVRKGNEMPKFRRNVVYTEIKILIVRKAAADAVIHQKAEYALEAARDAIPAFRQHGCVGVVFHKNRIWELRAQQLIEIEALILL